MTINKDVRVSAKKKKYTDFDVNVFGLKIPVRFVPQVDDSMGTRAAGMFTRDSEGKETIYVSTDDNDSHKAIVETVFHECAHSVIYRLGLHKTSLNHDLSLG